MMEPQDSLENVTWIPRPRLTALRRLGIETVLDLLTHYPRRHEDRREFPGFPRDESEMPICLCGEVTKTRLMRFGGRRIFEAVLEEENAHALSQPLTCRWFNLSYVQKLIATGQQLVIFGRPKRKGARLLVDHPEFEVIENDEEISIHFRRITPVYPATEGVSQRVLRGIIFRVLVEFDVADVQIPLPAALENSDHEDALRKIHFPDNTKQLEKVREHIVLGEFFRMQLQIASLRSQIKARQARPRGVAGNLAREFLARLPFTLTSSQKKVLGEIKHDLETASPMNRLLQGDVGSGKTVIAIAAMLRAVEAGSQAALMAPTQILAEQHYEVLRRWLDPLGVRVALRTAARQEENSALPLFDHAAANASPGSTGCQPVVPESLSGTLGASPSQTRYSKRKLPHFERPWAKYAVTFSTRKKRVLSEVARDIVLDSLLHWNERRYTLYAACVMPDHVHVLLEPAIKEESKDGAVFFSLGQIFHSIKAHAARAINKAESSSGPVWEEEWFDRTIRSEADLQEKFDYILRTPFDAGLDENASYPWVWFPGIPPRQLARRRADCTPQRADSPCSPEKESDAPQVVVGTHALLYERAGLGNPGLVVIDEQHKFGVSQRAKLTAREPAPDVLVMTATPIPRTLTMTIYGDLDVSTIDEMPRGRGEIQTRVLLENEIGEALTVLRAELTRNRQAYIVYPLIDESEKLQAKAAAKEFEVWQERLRPFRCELLHGRIPGAQKQEIMERFRAGKTQALVSTTVIEVGVDVPNATVMLIENAERFGLSQLHQLRGRIGRGAHTSLCILMSVDKSPGTLAKLSALEKTTNGFEIAEADWNLRGPGDLLGTAQSGLADFKLGDLKRDSDLMRRARAAARALLEADPELEEPENQRFRSLIVERQEQIYAHVS